MRAHAKAKRETESQERIRVQFEFTPDALARLDALKLVTEAATRAETLRNALRVYEWLVNQALVNNTVTITNESKEIVAQLKARLLLGLPDESLVSA